MSFLCVVISDGRKVSWPHVMERDGQKNVLSLCSGKGWLESVRALCMGIARKMGMEGGGMLSNDENTEINFERLGAKSPVPLTLSPIILLLG